MASVWYVGPNVSQRTITVAAWLRKLGPGSYEDEKWSVKNGWSIPESEFSEDQLEYLGSLAEFKLGQIDGPRTYPAPPPTPDPADGGNAYVYYKAIIEFYATVLAIIDGWVPGEGGGGGDVTWGTLSGKPSTFPPSAHTHTQGQVDGLTDALAAKATTAALADAVSTLSTAIGGRATPADISTAVGSLTTLINDRVQTSVFTSVINNIDTALSGKATNTALTNAVNDLTTLLNGKASNGALTTAINDLTTLINARALPSAISTAINAVIGGATSAGNTLKKLEDLIAGLVIGAGTRPPLTLDPVDGWPERPDVDYPLFWIGGDAPDDKPPTMPEFDVWLPRTGDNIDLGPIIESLQALTGTINTIPYFSASNVFSLLTLVSAMSSTPSETNILNEAGTKSYVDKIPIARVVTTSGDFSVDDKFKYVEVNSSSPVTMTLQASTLSQDEWLMVRSINIGIVTIAGTGVVAPGGRLKLAGQWSDGILVCRGPAAYVFTGDATT